MNNQIVSDRPDLVNVDQLIKSDPAGSSGWIVFLADSGSVGAPLVCIANGSSVYFVYTLFEVNRYLGHLSLANPYIGPGPCSDVFSSAERAYLAAVWSSKWLAARVGLCFSAAASLVGGASSGFWPDAGRRVTLALGVDLTLQTWGFESGQYNGANLDLTRVPPAVLAGYREGRSLETTTHSLLSGATVPA